MVKSATIAGIALATVLSSAALADDKGSVRMKPPTMGTGIVDLKSKDPIICSDEFGGVCFQGNRYLDSFYGSKDATSCMSGFKTVPDHNQGRSYKVITTYDQTCLSNAKMIVDIIAGANERPRQDMPVGFKVINGEKIKHRNAASKLKPSL